MKTFDLTRDNKVVLAGCSDIEAIKYVHTHHSYSFDHACQYEGYKLIPTVQKMEVRHTELDAIIESLTPDEVKIAAATLGLRSVDAHSIAYCRLYLTNHHPDDLEQEFARQGIEEFRVRYCVDCVLPNEMCGCDTLECECAEPVHFLENHSK